MLGNGKVLNIGEDLEPHYREAALDLLVKDVETDPSVFLSQGDLGQSIAYYWQRLDGQGEQRHATQVCRDIVAGGFDRTFIFPKMAHRYLRDDHTEWLEELVGQASEKLLIFDGITSLYALSSLAQLLRDDIPAAVQSINTAFFIEPLEGMRDNTKTLERAASLLMHLGHIDETNFPPFDPNIYVPSPKGHFEGSGETNKKLTALSETVPRHRRFALEPIGRDWMTLPGGAIFPPGFTGRFRKESFVMERLNKLLSQSGQTDTPSGNSLSGRMAADLENYEDAKSLHEKALAEAPDNALFVKRMADLHFALGDDEAGLTCLAQAAELSDHNIWFEASYVQHLARTKGPKDTAVIDRLVALAGRAHPFPTIRLVVNNWLRRLPRRKDLALAEIDLALEQVPTAPRLQLERAKTLNLMKREDEANMVFETIARSENFPYNKQASGYLDRASSKT